MPRVKGAKNSDFESSRSAILERLCAHFLVTPDSAQMSFRSMAEAAGVSVPTLRHYFVDREGVLKEAMAAYRRSGEVYVRHAAEFAPRNLRESLAEFAAHFIEGWNFGVGAIHRLGLLAGIGNENTGPVYVNDLLEPTVQALEARLRKHSEQGIFPKHDYRHAAVAFIAPLFLALIHQDSLFGRRCRPLDLKAFLSDHVRGFIRGWGPQR
jgi:AcrR family transcriptional regulator